MGASGSGCLREVTFIPASKDAALAPRILPREDGGAEVACGWWVGETHTS